ncbi:ABC transporter ATP-binding protein [Brevibacterium oceani]|uniref:ABC transporter ATP-binding protein n=1 Tax=Brevibacterium oceani TaxID=358099 RepID=UPI001B33FBE1|nr:ABC transporter ATP-binding protein [Brevibacterium oceani]
MTVTQQPLLTVDDLGVVFSTDNGPATSVGGLSFDLYANETLCLVGESGSGKSITSMAIMGLLPRTAEVTGSIRFRGDELLTKTDGQLRELRGSRISMVFQDALAALNPVKTVGGQLMEAVRVHAPKRSRAEERARAIELLDIVGIPTPDQRVDQYPHEFSGGMRQRIMIAMSIANDPDVLIADEPTTALDVTVQAQVLEVLRRVQERTNSALLLITHDLGVVAGLADRVLVMYSGKKVEEGEAEDIFYRPSHPYTLGLLEAMPRLDESSGDSPLYSIPGSPPDPSELPPGCRFAPRCRFAVPGTCDSSPIPEREISDRHSSVCLRIDEVAAVRQGEST